MVSEIEVKIGNKPYRLAVDDGQENRVRSVASTFDTFVKKMQSAGGSSMERDRVLVLAGIMMADEFQSWKEETEIEERTLEGFHNSLADRLEKLLDL